MPHQFGDAATQISWRRARYRPERPRSQTMTRSLNSFNALKTLEVGGKTFTYFSLPDAEKNGLDGIARLPFSLKVLLENLLRHEDGRTVTADDIRAVADWLQ
jgi:aconitate hydratase